MLRKRLLIAFVVAVPVLLAAGALSVPIVGAMACAACYHFDPMGEDVFVEHGASVAERAQVTDVLADARGRVRAFYGSLDATPRIFVCLTEECDRRLGGGGARGNAIIDLALRLSPRGIDPVIASHELSHIEFHHRLGLVRFLSGAVPAWFDEGLAVVVSDDLRYLAPVSAADRCLVRSDATLPGDRREWTRAAGADHELYAKAACRVATWLKANGGSAAVIRLLRALSDGTSFHDAYAERLG